MKQKGVVNTSKSSAKDRVTAYAFKAGATTRDTDAPTADPELIVNVERGTYRVALDLFWIFANGDGATITYNGGSASISTATLEEWAIADTDDTKGILYTFKSAGDGAATAFNLDNVGDVYMQTRGVVTFTTDGTFALKWGGLSGGAIHTLSANSSLSLVQIQ